MKLRNFLLALLPLSLHGQLFVDFSQTGAESGYNGYLATHENSGSFTAQSFSAFGTSVTITPDWPDSTDSRVRQMIERGAGNNANWIGEKIDLLKDYIGVDTRTGNGGNGDYDGTTGSPTTLTLTLSGLPAGSYQWLSYHHDTENVFTSCAIAYSSDGGLTFTALPGPFPGTDSTDGGNPASPQTYTGSPDPDPAALPSTAIFDVTAEAGKNLVLRFIPLSTPGVHQQIWAMNGFELTELGLPSVINSTATDIMPTSATIGGEVTNSGANTPNVTVYWGASNGGTNAGTWANNIPLGTTTGAFNLPLSSLNPSTTYFYRALATNSAGASWAASSASFTTSADGSPASVTTLAATDVSFTQADVNGNVTSTGGDTPLVTLFYGLSDGGNVGGNWDESTPIGAQSGPFTDTLINLSNTTTYFFRFQATNVAGTTWSSASQSFTTLAFTPPSVTSSVAEFITGNSALIPGEVTDTGNDAPEITIFYGTSDGGTNPGSWQSQSDLGPISATFSETIGNLTGSTTHYFRIRATNTAGVAWSTPTRSFNTGVSSDIVVNEFMASNSLTAVPNALPATFEDWIELKNLGAAPIDLGGWRLTDSVSDLNLWTFPANTTVNPGAFLVVFASGENQPDTNGNLHTNFKLSKTGEFVTLVRPNGTIASSYGPGGSDYPAQSDDISYGRHPVSAESVFFSTPTPGAENDASGIAKVNALTVSPNRGFYQSAQSLTLSTISDTATIYYTTDGTPPLDASGNPTTSAQTYSAPIAINQTTVLRAAAALTGFAATDSVSHTYVLLDIDGAAANGTDPGGLNTPFLQQTQPAGYGALSSGDYNMGTSVSQSTIQSAGHGGISISQAMLQGMRDVPTISIALPKEDFAGGNGIYSNSTAQGLAWERACSAEFIPAENDTRSDFQENCGLRVQGGASREPNKSPKHSLSFRFREEYGAGRLKQALFPDSDVDNFNSIALRAGYNNSWIHSDSNQRGRASMIRDQWMRESMLDMGHEDAGRGFLAHVFINGLYWGLHNVAERQDNVHYAHYNGGDSDQIDALNGTKFVQGTSTAWNTMKSVVSTKDWADIQQVLDVDTYIDYQILQRYGANQDLKTNGNWRAAGGGPFTIATEMRPWKLFSWDGERVLESPTDTLVPLDPMGIRGTLETMPEYRLRFADRAQFHLTGNGALTPARSQARWVKYADPIDKAIIAESARWGDHRRNPAYTRTEWLTEQTRLYNTYFPVRTANVINKLTTDNLYDKIEQPEFKVDGIVSTAGYIAPGSALTVTGPEGFIYYTLDGSDPANPDGTINPAALSIASGTATEPAFPFESSGWRYLAGTTALSSSNVVVGNGSYNSGDWKHESFNDGSWEPGTGLIAGLSVNSIDAATANTIIDIGPTDGRYPTVYFRKSFNVTNASEIGSLDASVIRDDGFILYLNGKEIFRDNVGAGTIDYNFYTGNQANESSIPTTTYTLAPGDLKEGSNVIAIEVHNANNGSSDLGVDVALELNRAIGASSVTLPASSSLTARSRVGTSWSAPVTGTFLLEPSASPGNLAISEINYHPREATLLEKNSALPLDVSNRDDFEFIELLNTSGSPLNLAGSTFTNGVNIEFGFRVVAPGERVVVARNPEAFLHRYGSSLSNGIVGTYSGGLDNDGETLTLVTPSGGIIETVTYNDAGSWPSRPDGAGSSLERIDLSSDPNLSSNWTSSVAFHGSPGVSGKLSDKRIVINEISANSANDFIEIYNTTASPIDISAWLLSDSKDVYRSFQFPTTTITAMGYLAIDATAFDAPATNLISTYSGTSSAAPTTVTSASHGLTTGDLISIRGYGGFSAYNDSFEITVTGTHTFTINTPFLDNNASKGSWRRGRPFGLSAGNGDDLWLLETDGNGNPVAFVDHIEFAAADPGRTLGRWLDGEGYDTLFPMVSETKAATNSGPLLGPVFLSEVLYHPTGSDNHEFVEITNQLGDTVSLAHWKLRGGVDFNFTASDSLAPGASLVLVNFDPVSDTALAANFRATFQIDNSVPLAGPFTDGPLNDDQGTIRLQKSGPGPDFSQITVDEVRYLATAPWPVVAAENGSSLQRIPTLGFGNFASSWTAATPTPGTSGGETYPDWATANGVGSGSENPDGDQLSNLLEFALGTNPNSANDLPTYRLANGTGTISVPVHTGRQGVQLFFETSSDLENWAPAATTSAGVNGEIQTREFEFSQAANLKLYWRLRAVQAP